MSSSTPNLTPYFGIKSPASVSLSYAPMFGQPSSPFQGVKPALAPLMAKQPDGTMLPDTTGSGRQWTNTITGIISNLFGNRVTSGSPAPPINRFAPVQDFSSGQNNLYSMLASFRPYRGTLEDMVSSVPGNEAVGDSMRLLMRNPSVAAELGNNPVLRSLY